MHHIKRYYSIKECTSMIHMENLIGTIVICGICVGNINHSKCYCKRSHIVRLNAVHIPYMGICGTIYGRIYTVFSLQAARMEQKFAE